MCLTTVGSPAISIWLELSEKEGRIRISARVTGTLLSSLHHDLSCMYAHTHRTVTDPYLNLFRGIIPPIGGTLDLSPILAFVTLNVSTDCVIHAFVWRWRLCDLGKLLINLISFLISSSCPHMHARDSSQAQNFINLTSPCSTTPTQFFTSTAAALPCELGPDGQPAPSKAQQQQRQSPFQFMQPTRLQAAWQHRVNAQRSVSSADNSGSV